MQYTHGIDRAVEIAGETADRIVALEPATRSSGEVDWGEVVPLCALLARYEQAGRSEFAAGQVAVRLRDVRPTPHTRPRSSPWRTFRTSRRSPRRSPRTARTYGSTSRCCWAGRSRCQVRWAARTPTSAGRTLIDLKGGAAQRVIRKRDIHQLAGYALADADDQHGLGTVSIHALRWRTRWSISLQSLLDTLAGGPTDIPALRSEFASTVAATRAR